MRFINFYYLKEEKLKFDSGSSINNIGVMHELLTLKHLNGGKFPENFVNKNNQSPKNYHDIIKQNFTEDQYNYLDTLARKTADHIKSQLPSHAKNLTVHWTSKEGDITKVTNIHSTQHDDASDLVVSYDDHTHPTGKRYVGVSLKMKKGKNLFIKNPGLEDIPGSNVIHQEHKRKIASEFGHILTGSVKDKKDMLKSNPELKSKIVKYNNKLLNDLTDRAYEHFSNMNQEQLHHFIRHTIHAHETPMQKYGHDHLRVITNRKTGKIDSYRPNEHFDDFMKNNPGNIEVKRNGFTLNFYKNGKHFMSYRRKLESQSNPYSSVKSVVAIHI
jgi:hypothetical protein